MVSKTETNLKRNGNSYSEQYYLPNQQLDIKTVLLKFQAFMQEYYSNKDQKFLEREGRLIFLAFLKPILNGQGHTFIEPQISTEKRLDVVITYYQHKYIIELKLWYGEKAHQEGLDQLSDYLERQQQEKGWLVIFDHRKNKTWAKKQITNKGKVIFSVWV